MEWNPRKECVPLVKIRQNCVNMKHQLNLVWCQKVELIVTPKSSICSIPEWNASFSKVTPWCHPYTLGCNVQKAA